MALGAALHYGWSMAPAEHAAQVWNICGAVARAALLVFVACSVRHPLVWSVAAWWIAEETMVAGCSALYIARPWVVPPGQAQCSSLLGADIGLMGGSAVMVLLCAISVISYRWQGDE